MDPHKMKLERKLERIAASDISLQNKKLIQDFKRICIANCIGVKRILRYMDFLDYLAHQLRKDFDQVDKQDMVAFIATLEGSDYAAWTKYTYKIMLRHFYKIMFGNGEVFPETVRWIKTPNIAPKHYPHLMLTPNEVYKLITSTTSPRDRAIVSFLFESGCRAGELLGMKICDLEMGKGPLVKVMLSGKTGDRRVPIVQSIPYITTWLSLHPCRNDPLSPLWISERRYWYCDECAEVPLNGKHKYVLCRKRGHTPKPRAMTHASLAKVLKNITPIAGVDKPTNPHHFRKSQATNLANRLTDQQLKLYFGWSMSSKMVATYIHLSARDLEGPIAQMHGVAPPDPQVRTSLSPRICTRCSKTNESTAELCMNCALPLSLKSAVNYNEASNTLEELINRRVEEILKEKLQRIVPVKRML